MNPFLYIGMLLRARRYRVDLEQREVRFVRDTLSRGQVAFDIGAHKGAFTYWMRAAVGPTGHVYAFEPQPVAARLIARTVRTFRWMNVTSEHLGLSDSCGNQTLHIPDGRRGMAPLASFQIPQCKSWTTAAVPVTRLDAYVERHGIERVDFLKIDVEGHELEVFKGAVETLIRHHPALLFECEARHRKGGVTPVLRWLEDLGYTGKFIIGGTLRPIDEFDEGKHQVFGRAPYAHNFAFVYD